MIYKSKSYLPDAFISASQLLGPRLVKYLLSMFAPTVETLRSWLTQRFGEDIFIKLFLSLGEPRASIISIDKLNYLLE